MEEQFTSSAEYAFAPDRDADGTYLYGAILLPPAGVRRRFGQRNDGDGYKVSRQWVFRKGDMVFTLYDWKCTDVYAPGLPTPDEFWASEEPQELHVGSKSPATTADGVAFAMWLNDEVQRVC